MAGNHYLTYSASQLAMDESFQQWILHPNLKHVFWENWLLQYPEKTELVEQARSLVQSIRFRNYELAVPEKEALWNNIWNGIAEEPGTDELTVTPVRKWKSITRYAAAVITGIVLMAGWQWFNTGKQAPVTLSAHTKPGETKQLQLPDSSIVTLNANSKILYTINNNAEREVWLDGEAFFNVKHTSSNQPFTVHTYDNLDVKVLGTQFNVNSLGKEIVVVLETGRIMLNIDNKSAALYLKPGEMIKYNKSDGSFAKTNVNVAQYTAWKSGKLVMEDFSLSDAATFMKQVFGKTIVISDSQLLNYKVSGSMPIVYDPDTMMTQLSKVFHTRFNQRGDEIWIHKK